MSSSVPMPPPPPPPIAPPLPGSGGSPTVIFNSGLAGKKIGYGCLVLRFLTNICFTIFLDHKTMLLWQHQK